MERRQFIAHGLGALAASAAWRVSPAAGLRASERAAGIRFGYAAITWGGDDRRAIDDIASVGFRGIQLRASAFAEWGERPGELADLLAARNLTFVALSSGVVRIDPAAEAETLDEHVRHARFLREAGGLYLQVMDERPRGREITADDYRRMGGLLTELGRRTADLGIPLGYHNHMGNLGQAPDEVSRVLDAADSRFVKLELDMAHYRQAGGDPVRAVSEYADRLLFLHVKDLESPVPGEGPGSYRFVELGRGAVDLPAFFDALDRVSFDGWAIVELDRVVTPETTPKDAAIVARDYIQQTLGLSIDVAAPMEHDAPA
ncbi:MAG: sugar phosphate isomerase/epimerase family protein [Longimicrobiales bacterium]